VRGREAEEGRECGVPIAAVIEAINELVEIRLEMPAAQAVVDAESPDFEVGEDAVYPAGGFSASVAPLTRESSLMPGPPE